jgi:hypothetical protein
MTDKSLTPPEQLAGLWRQAQYGADAHSKLPGDLADTDTLRPHGTHLRRPLRVGVFKLAPAEHHAVILGPSEAGPDALCDQRPLELCEYPSI